MQSKYDKVNSKINTSSLSPVDECALMNISNAILNAEVLMHVIPQYRHDGNIDILALIQLHYQNLGAALENIPYETRRQYPALGAIYGESKHNKYKSFILRSTVAHYTSFYYLHTNYTPEAGATILEEAREIYSALVAVVTEYANIPASLKSLINAPLKDKDALLSNSSGVKCANGARPNPHSLLDLFSSCQEVMDLTNQCLSRAKRIDKSFPMQSLVILARQFIGENIRQANYIFTTPAIGAFLSRVDAIRRTRNKLAHKSIIFEQGADDPDGLAWCYTQICNAHSQDFARQINTLRQQVASHASKVMTGGSRFLPLSVTAQEDQPSYQASPSSSSSSSSASSSSLPQSSSSAVSPSAVQEFRSYILDRLDLSIPRVRGLVKLQDWSIDTIFLLCFSLISEVVSAGRKKTEDERSRDLGTLNYIIDNFHKTSNHESSRDLINYPCAFNYSGIVMQAGEKIYQYSATLGSALYTIACEDNECVTPATTIYLNLLTCAVILNNFSSLQFLLEKGAQPSCFYYYPGGSVRPLVIHAMNIGYEEFAIELLNYGAILNRQMMPKKMQINYNVGGKSYTKVAEVNFSAFELMYRKGVGLKLLTTFLNITDKAEVDGLRIIWHTFYNAPRFMENCNESIYLMQNIAKICFSRWGMTFASQLFDKSDFYKLDHEKNKKTHRGPAKVDAGTIYELFDQSTPQFPLMHDVAMVFLNIKTILCGNLMKGQCTLHLNLLLDQNIVQALCSTELKIIKPLLKEKPVPEDARVKSKYAKELYDPQTFAKKLGKRDAFYAIKLFSQLCKIFKQSAPISLIMEYRYDEAEIQKVQSSPYFCSSAGSALREMPTYKEDISLTEREKLLSVFRASNLAQQEFEDLIKER